MWEDDKKRDDEAVPVRVVDRRRFHETPDGEVEENAGAEEALDRRPTYVRELEERLAASEERLQQTLEAHRDRLQEFDQIRARLDRDFGVRVWDGERVRPVSGFTRLYIHPGKDVHTIDGLVTGFHDPMASHLAMLYALAGEELVRSAYVEAVSSGYLWHEFGDSNLILPNG